MQDRFGFKDFVYMLFAALICLLLWLNMVKTSREVESLETLTSRMKDQDTTLSSLKDAIGNLESSPTLDPETLQTLLASAGSSNRSGTDGSAIPSGSSSDRDSENDTDRTGNRDAERSVNLAEKPEFKPAYDITQAVWTKNQNLKGEPQEWQAAPDSKLPDDFATGDTLIKTEGSDAQSLTPLVTNDAYARRVHWYTHEYLVNFDLDAPFELTPGLAREWEVSDDGFTLTFRLFEHATWSDGEPVTADDVIFTWDTAMNSKHDTAHLRGYIEPNVESWRKLDDHTVQFKMKQEYFDAVGICGQLLPIIPEHVYGDYDEDTFNEDIQDVCVGSGPYVLEKWEKNRQIVLVRNNNYWGSKPALERIVTRIIKNDLANLQEFKARNVDLIAPTAEQWTESINAPWFREKEVKKNLYYSPRGGYSYIGYNLRKPHFAEKRTRQALTMLIDRQAIIDNLLNGMGRVISGPFYFKSDQYNHDVEPWPYDPERAKALLADVGWEDTDNDGVLDKDLTGNGQREPFEVTYLLPAGSSGDFGDKLQRFVKDAFGEAGIKLNLDRLEWTVFLERLNSRQYDMVTLSWTGGVEGDPYQIWHSDSEANKGSNHVGFKNERADELIELGRRTMDYDQRMKYWHKFHEIIHEEQPYTFITARPGRSFIDPRFKNNPQRDYRLYYNEWYVPSADQLR